MEESSDCLAFNVRNTLRKPYEIPVVDGWKIAASEVLVTSKVLSCYKSKGLLWDRKSEVLDRRVTILKSGHMILYMDESKGFVLDLRGAKDTAVRSRNLASGKEPKRRCDVRIRFRFGSVHLHLEDNEVHKWREAIEKIDEKIVTEKRRLGISLDLITVYPSEDDNSEIGSEAAFAVSTGKESESIQSLTSSEEENITVAEKIDEVAVEGKKEVAIDSCLEQEVEDSDVSETLVASRVSEVAAAGIPKETRKENIKKIVEYSSESSCSGLFTEEESSLSQTNGPSIRTGYATVRLLKEKIEHKIENAK